ncbi:MAG: ASCH domain-containing protein [Candidatus Moraniibacteriota bacterium]|nr:MAG: ASCH domain-containing protein [Candidatus Moranbacteria bacterium]
MKTLKFTDSLSKLVLSGAKTSTWRMFDDKALSVGDELSFINKSTGEEFAQARIVTVRKRLSEQSKKRISVVTRATRAGKRCLRRTGDTMGSGLIGTPW